MDEGEHPLAAAHDREAAPAHLLGDVSVGGVVGSRPVELAVAQHHAFDPWRLRRLALVLERRAGAAREGLGRIGPGPRLLVLDHLALRRVDEGDALGDEAADTGLARRFDQVVTALGARSVGRPVVDLPRVVLAGKAGELADHDLRRRIPYRGLHRLRVERVADDGRRARGLDPAAFSGLLVIPVTSCPAATSWRTSGRPITPLAPATNTFIGLPLRSGLAAPGAWSWPPPRPDRRTAARRARCRSCRAIPRASLRASPTSKAWLMACSPYQIAPSTRTGARHAGRWAATSTAIPKARTKAPTSPT